MHHTLLVHQFDGHSGCFQVLVVLNEAAVNIYVQVFVWTHVFIFLESISRTYIALSF